MEGKTAKSHFAEKQPEPGQILDKYYSVQFSLNDCDPVYMFKLRNISDNGLCILVKEDSAVLKRLKENDTLNMEYNPSESRGSSKFLKTKIREISNKHYGSFTGHSLVGLSIIDEHNDRL